MNKIRTPNSTKELLKNGLYTETYITLKKLKMNKKWNMTKSIHYSKLKSLKCQY